MPQRPRSAIGCSSRNCVVKISQKRFCVVHFGRPQIAANAHNTIRAVRSYPGKENFSVKEAKTYIGAVNPRKTDFSKRLLRLWLPSAQFPLGNRIFRQQ